jgi:hypothetical protein
MVGKPLYSVRSMGDVEELLGRVRAAVLPAPEGRTDA